MSDHLTDAELDELERKAMAANDIGPQLLFREPNEYFHAREDDALFICAANPETIQRLISEIRERRRGETR